MWLVGVNTPLGNLPFYLERGEFVVGRTKGSQIVISERTISRTHARLTYDGCVLTVEDLGSSNGTFVNEVEVSRRELRLGDYVRFGSVACVISATRLFPRSMSEDESTYQVRVPTPADDTALLDTFTPAQLRIIPLLKEGKSEPEIAEILGNSPHTIHAHIRAIFERLGVHSREQLIVRLMERG